MPQTESQPVGESARALRRQLYIFFGAVVLISSAVGVNESIFNNFLSDTFRLAADQRGRLEFPRELPGLLIVVLAGALAALPLTRLGMTGAAVLAAGLGGIALFGAEYWPMVLMMIVASAGMHLIMPVGSSIAIGLSGNGNRGRNLGLLGAVGNIGMILGAGCIYLALDREHPQYRIGFLAAAMLAGFGTLAYGLLHIPRLHQPRSRLVVRKEYSLYYALELLFGARKQIFITFGPWVLIKIYGQPANEIAFLFAVAASIGIVSKPLIGMAIDHFGERTVLVADGLILSVVCLGYGFAKELTGDPETARHIACTCFVLDNLLFALGSGREVYVSHLTPSTQELTSTLSMGMSINHIVSMSIPAVGGALWVAFNYQSVFAIAALLALGSSAVSCLVPGKREAQIQRGTT